VPPSVSLAGIKPNVSNLGGDQFDVSDPQEAKDQEQFFSYFYLMINVGAGISYGYLTTLAQNGAPPTIPKVVPHGILRKLRHNDDSSPALFEVTGPE
jgi:hypothetical protein